MFSWLPVFLFLVMFILLFLSLLCHCFKVMICMYVCYMLFTKYSILNTQLSSAVASLLDWAFAYVYSTLDVTHSFAQFLCDSWVSCSCFPWLIIDAKTFHNSRTTDLGRVMVHCHAMLPTTIDTDWPTGRVSQSILISFSVSNWAVWRSWE